MSLSTRRKSSKDLPLVAILVINWNGKDLLYHCLKSIALTTYKNFCVVVIDNGSTDGSSELVTSKFPHYTLLRLEENCGFSGANNKGIRFTLEKFNPDYFLLLNNDTEILNSNWLDILVSSAEQHTAAKTGCKLLFPDNTIQNAGISFWPDITPGQFSSQVNRTITEQVAAVTGACFMISRSCISEIGILDEVYSPFGCEDLDYCLRARSENYTVLYEGHTSMLHKEGTTIDKSGVYPDKWRFYIYSRNHFILRLRYAPLLETIRYGIRRFGAIFMYKDHRANKILLRKVSVGNYAGLFISYLRALVDAAKTYKNKPTLL